MLYIKTATLCALSFKNFETVKLKIVVESVQAKVRHSLLGIWYDSWPYQYLPLSHASTTGDRQSAASAAIVVADHGIPDDGPYFQVCILDRLREMACKCHF